MTQSSDSQQAWRRLFAMDCVPLVRYDVAAHGGPHVKVMEPEAGALGVRFGSSDAVLPMRVETIARGDAACEFVAGLRSDPPNRPGPLDRHAACPSPLEGSGSHSTDFELFLSLRWLHQASTSSSPRSAASLWTSGGG